MAKKSPIEKSVVDLLYQALETEQGGIMVYETAISCAVNDELRQEWTDYLAETRRHEQILASIFADFGLDPEQKVPGQAPVAIIGDALVQAMETAKATLSPAQAELVACEAVVLAETKDHSNWELIGHIVKNGRLSHLDALKAAHDEVEKQEDHHLYHTKGWCRELWIQNLGFPAVLPPPEEVKQVETAIGASRAEQTRKDLL